MNDDRLFELLEATAVMQGLALLISQAEAADNDSPEHMAMIFFFKTIYRKYKRKVGAHRISTDSYGNVKLTDAELRRFNTN